MNGETRGDKRRLSQDAGGARAGYKRWSRPRLNSSQVLYDLTGLYGFSRSRGGAHKVGPFPKIRQSTQKPREIGRNCFYPVKPSGTVSDSSRSGALRVGTDVAFRPRRRWPSVASISTWAPCRDDSRVRGRQAHVGKCTERRPSGISRAHSMWREIGVFANRLGRHHRPDRKLSCTARIEVFW